MKSILANKKTLIALIAVTILLLGCYVYMLARPVSYGFAYRYESEYAGETFEGYMVFHWDGTMSFGNDNFEEEQEGRHYYKNGYLFHLLATTDEEYAEEVAYIDENFDEAIAYPFYAFETSAFKQTPAGIADADTTYTCTAAIVLAIVGGAVALALVSATGASVLLCKKAKDQ